MRMTVRLLPLPALMGMLVMLIVNVSMTMVFFFMCMLQLHGVIRWPQD